MKGAALLLLLSVIVGSNPALARSDAKCLVSFARDNGGWSAPRRVDVEFYTARELFPNDDRAYPIYAKIWYNPENPAIVALDGTSLVVPEFYDSSLEKLFRSGQPRFGTERNDPERWRIQAVINGRWVDRRYPGAFEASSSPPPPDGVLRRSFISGPNRICVYDQLGSANVLTVDANASCP